LFAIITTCRKEFIGELALLQSLRHPNIVQFLGAVTKTRPLVIVTEYFPKVNLLLPTYLLLFCCVFSQLNKVFVELYVVCFLKIQDNAEL
jgi:serine/threonine protein kinase